MKLFNRIDESTPRDTRILLYKKAKNGPEIIVMGELTEYEGKTHHLWNGLYGETVHDWKHCYSPRWNGKFTHWLPLEND